MTMYEPRNRHISPYFAPVYHAHAHQPTGHALRNHLDTAPNLQLIELQYAPRVDEHGNVIAFGATFAGFYSRVDGVVIREDGAIQARGPFYRWKYLHQTH